MGSDLLQHNFTVRFSGQNVSKPFFAPYKNPILVEKTRKYSQKC